MPRVLPTKPRFASDEEVVAVDSFTGDLDGEPFVVNPSQILRGDHRIVRAYPWMFRRLGDEEAQAAYWDRLNAEAAERRRREDEAESKRREAERKLVMELADKLEAEERKRRESNPDADFWRWEGERKRRRAEAEAKEAEEKRIRALAEAEVARRLGDAA